MNAIDSDLHGKFRYSLRNLLRYQKKYLYADLSAGLTTAVMLIPQGMAYAMLAGLPPIMGLYASTVPLAVYALFGSSRQLAIGPVAMASLLLAAGMGELFQGQAIGVEQMVQMAILVTFLVGVFQIILGMFRLGGLVNLLSHPVVSGFTFAAAIIIGVSQLQHLFGFQLPKGGAFYSTLIYLVEHIERTNLATFCISMCSIGTIFLLKKVNPRIPAALVTVFIGIICSYFFDLASFNVDLVGSIPAGLPTSETPQLLNREMIEDAIPISIAIALIAFMESISAAKIYARQNRYAISPTRELVGQGLANISSSFFGGYVVGGALSRTAVNAEAGAKSKLAGIFTALVIAFTLAFLTAPFSYLPKPILAAIIMVAVLGLMDFEEIKHLWNIKKDDLALLLVTFCATLFLSIEWGIVVGVFSSLLWLVFCTTRPNVAVLGKVPGTSSYRSIEHFSDAVTFEQILVVRMDAQFFFGNVAYLKETLFDRVSKIYRPVVVVIDASSMNALDSTAADTFAEIIQTLRRKNIEIMVSHVKGVVLEVMEIAGIVEILGEGHIYYEVHDAVNAAIRYRDAINEGMEDEDSQEVFGKSDMLD
jgi:sulfate permease, SulP family